MAQVGELIVKLRAESAVFTQNMENARKTTARTHQGIIDFSEGGGRGFRKLENAAFSLSTGMAGLHGEVARVAEGFLLLGVGGAVMDGVIIALAAAGAVYEKLTEKTKKATEETDKFIEAQLKAARLRADPNADVLAGIAGARQKAAGLASDTAKIGNRSDVQNALDPFGFFGKQLTSKKEGITTALQGVAAAQGTLQKSGFDLIKTLATEGATFGMSAEAAQRFAISMDGSLDPATRKLALTLSHHNELLRLAKEAHDAAAKAALEHAQQEEAFWLGIDRVANQAGSMVIQKIKDLNAAHKKADDASYDAIFAKAQGQAGLIQRPAIFDRMERDAEFMEETWKNAIRGVQDAFAQFFEDIGKRGTGLVTLLEDIARTVQKSLAQIAAKKLVDTIFGGINLGGGGIAAAPSMGSIGDYTAAAPKLSLASAPQAVQVHQNITFHAGFVDGGSGEAWLRSKAGAIAGIVADAATTAPVFARHIVSQGTR